MNKTWTSLAVAAAFFASTATFAVAGECSANNSVERLQAVYTDKMGSSDAMGFDSEMAGDAAAMGDMFTAVEEEFCVELSTEDRAGISTFGDLVEAIERIHGGG